jgi:hypothetical protein
VLPRRSVASGVGEEGACPEARPPCVNTSVASRELRMASTAMNVPLRVMVGSYACIVEEQRLRRSSEIE